MSTIKNFRIFREIYLEVHFPQKGYLRKYLILMIQSMCSIHNYISERAKPSSAVTDMLQKLAFLGTDADNVRDSLDHSKIRKVWNSFCLSGEARIPIQNWSDFVYVGQ
jgi:hypothetical protein